jgi:ABC-type branched-subunit amino acid transport system substrate-binding protein
VLRTLRFFNSIGIGATLFLAICCCVSARGLADDSGLAATELQGRDIYRNGMSHGQDIAARIQGEIEVLARNFPCANCHGQEGEGRKEGGLNVPPLHWETTVQRAIVGGVNSEGLHLNPAMPRFQLNDAQLTELIAYLKVVGSTADADPGVSAGLIKIGTVLPLTGPLASIGQNVEAVLQAYFARVNASGGVYGRKFELGVADSRGEAEANNAAVHRLINQDHVFVLLASYEPNGSELEQQISAAQMPLVAPVSFRSGSDKVNPYRFDILPSFSDQARCLVNFVHAHQKEDRRTAANTTSTVSGNDTERYALMYGDGALDLDAVSGFRAQIREFAISSPAEFRNGSGPFPSERAAAFLNNTRPHYVFFFGASKGLKTVIDIAKTNNLDIRFVTTAAMAGDLAFTASTEKADTLWLAQALPTGDSAIASLRQFEADSHIKITNQAAALSAYVAAEVFLEAIKRSGRKLTRARLVDELESFKNFQTDVVPPITYGPNERAGAAGCVIVSIDPVKRGYTPLTDWISLEEPP